MNVHDFLEMIHKHDCPACGAHTDEDSDLCEDCLKELARAGESGFSMRGCVMSATCKTNQIMRVV